MKTPVKIFLTLIMFVIGSMPQTLRAANHYMAMLPPSNSVNYTQQHDSLNQPGSKQQLPKAYPPANPGQPHPDRVNPAGSGNPPVTPADTSHHRQAPPRHKAKLAGEQSKPQ